VIEFDGEYWHSSETANKRDKIKDNVLLERNYKLLRIPVKQ